MIALNDAQLKVVMTAASQVPHEKRAMFLERVGAALRFTIIDTSRMPRSPRRRRRR